MQNKFFSAIIDNDIALVKQLAFNDSKLINSVREDDYYKDTPLIVAAKNSNIEMCEVLIELGADINLINKYGMNPLFAAISEFKFKNANYFFDNKNINLKHRTYSKVDCFGQIFKTVQHFDGHQTHFETSDLQLIIEKMLDNGFDINAVQNETLGTPVVMAASAQSWPLVGFLISKGADYTFKNYLGDMWTYFQANQYLPPSVKEGYVARIVETVNNSGQKYGPTKKPEKLYVCSLSGKEFKFGDKAI